MIISHANKFIFLHNPKVAGSAIRKAMEHLHDDETVFWHQKFMPALDRVVDAAHLTFHDLELVCAEKGQILHGYTCLTVVRNPYKRFMSSVAEFLRQHPEECHDHWNLDEWMMKNMDEANFRFNWKYIHFCPQHYFVPRIQLGLTSFVAHHERLEKDWETWTKMINVKSMVLPKVRVRPDQEIGLKSLSPFAIREINRVYHEDFRRFGFERIDDVEPPCSHYERVNSIHSPYSPVINREECNSGEKIAWDQQQHIQRWF